MAKNQEDMNMEIKEIIQLLAQGVNPATGEVFDLSVLGQDDVYAAVKLLKDAASREHKKQAMGPDSSISAFCISR